MRLKIGTDGVISYMQLQKWQPGFLENPAGNRAGTRSASPIAHTIRRGSDVVARGRTHVPTLSNPTRPSRIPPSTTFPLTPSQDAPGPTRQRAACLVRCSERTMSQLLPSLGAVIAVHIPSDLITVVGQIRAADWLLWATGLRP